MPKTLASASTLMTKTLALVVSLIEVKLGSREALFARAAEGELPPDWRMGPWPCVSVRRQHRGVLAGCNRTGVARLLEQLREEGLPGVVAGGTAVAR